MLMEHRHAFTHRAKSRRYHLERPNYEVWRTGRIRAERHRSLVALIRLPWSRGVRVSAVRLLRRACGEDACGKRQVEQINRTITRNNHTVQVQ